MGSFISSRMIVDENISFTQLGKADKLCEYAYSPVFIYTTDIGSTGRLCLLHLLHLLHAGHRRPHARLLHPQPKTAIFLQPMHRGHLNLRQCRLSRYNHSTTTRNEIQGCKCSSVNIRESIEHVVHQIIRRQQSVRNRESASIANGAPTIVSVSDHRPALLTQGLHQDLSGKILGTCISTPTRRRSIFFELVLQ